MEIPTETPLARLLREEGRRQDWLAAQIGARPEQVSRWVQGVHLPVEATREAIANALRLPVDEVFPPQPEAAQAA